MSNDLPIYRTVLTFAHPIAPEYNPGFPHRLLIKCFALLGWQGVPVAAPPPPLLGLICPVMCKIYQTTTAINQFTSSIFLTVMSADRYIAVCHPISSPKFRTPVIARVVSLTAWTCSALLMVPVFMYAATITKQCGGQSCNIFWPFQEYNETSSTGINQLGFFDNQWYYITKASQKISNLFYLFYR